MSLARFRGAARAGRLVTTPIFYVNAAPHIGHVFSAVLADSMARAESMREGASGVMTTGTDEHGAKVADAAARASMPPKAFVDGISRRFQDAMRLYGVEWARFVRTTDPDHVQTARWLWGRLQDRGYIYKGVHRTWYCRSDEAFLPDSMVLPRSMFLKHRAKFQADLAAWSEAEQSGALQGPKPTWEPPMGVWCADADDSGAVGGGSTEGATDELAQRAAAAAAAGDPLVSAESGHEVTRIEEDGWMFRLSAFEAPLLEWLRRGGPDGTSPVLPEGAALDAQLWVQQDLTDLSISRALDRVPWAVPVPDDGPDPLRYQQYTHGDDSPAQGNGMYVWVDALANYLTVCDPLLSAPGAGNGSEDKVHPDELPTLKEDGRWEAGRRTMQIARNEPGSGLSWPAARPGGGSWPPAAHVIGKDINRFHCVYWPALLMAAGLALPERIVVHGHWTCSGIKMSKSLGNVVDPVALVRGAGAQYTQPPPAAIEDASAANAAQQPATDGLAAEATEGIGDGGVVDGGVVDGGVVDGGLGSLPRPATLTGVPPDVARWFMLREGSLENDGNFTALSITARAAELIDGLGNLAARATGAAMLPEARLPDPEWPLPLPEMLLCWKVRNAAQLAGPLFAEGRATAATAQLAAATRALNQHFSLREPWTLAAGRPNCNPELHAAVLWTTLEGLRVVGTALQPAIPQAATLLLEAMGVPSDRRRWLDCEFGIVWPEGWGAEVEHAMAEAGASPDVTDPNGCMPWAELSADAELQRLAGTATLRPVEEWWRRPGCNLALPQPGDEQAARRQPQKQGKKKKKKKKKNARPSLLLFDKGWEEELLHRSGQAAGK